MCVSRRRPRNAVLLPTALALGDDHDTFFWSRLGGITPNDALVDRSSEISRAVWPMSGLIRANGQSTTSFQLPHHCSEQYQPVCDSIDAGALLAIAAPLSKAKRLGEPVLEEPLPKHFRCEVESTQPSPSWGQSKSSKRLRSADRHELSYIGRLVDDEADTSYHIRVWQNSTGSKFFDCGLCDKRKPIQDLGSLKKHIRRHDVTEYPCKECGKIFAGPYKLNAHRRVHKGKD